MAARSFAVPKVDSVAYGVGAFESIGDLVQLQGAARAFVVLSGSLAGTAVEATLVGIGLSHGIGHQLAAEFDVLHGLTSAIMLPLVMEFNAAHTAPGLRRIAEAMGTDTTGLDDRQAAAAAVRTMRELIVSLGVPHTLRAVGANRDALPAVAQRTLRDPAVAASPRPVSTQNLLELLEAAW